MNKTLKIIAGAVVAAFIAIQFIPNHLPENSDDLSNDLLEVETLPGEIVTMLRESCYDCHSSQVKYPWYSHLAPVSWLVAKDVREGRDELNLSDWGRLEKRKKIKALSGIAEEVEKGNMPLPIYITMHPGAKLSDEQKKILVEWSNALSNRLFEN